MKQIVTIFFLAGIFLFTAPVQAGNDLLGNNYFNQNLKLKKCPSLNSKNIFSQESKSFGEGKMAISVGYGAMSGGFLKVLLKTYEDEAGYNFTSFGPIHFRGEYGLSDGVGLVVSVNHNSWQASWTHMDSSLTSPIYHDEVKRSVTSILARLNFHFGVTEKIDPYFGVGAGYRIVDFSFNSTDVNYGFSFKSPFHAGFETTVGVRCYLTKSIGVYGEIGLAQSLLQGGLVASF